MTQLESETICKLTFSRYHSYREHCDVQYVKTQTKETCQFQRISYPFVTYIRHRFFIATSLYFAHLALFPPLPTLLHLPLLNLSSPAPPPLTNPSHPPLSWAATTLSSLTNKSTFPQCSFSFSFFLKERKNDVQFQKLLNVFFPTKFPSFLQGC